MYNGLDSEAYTTNETSVVSAPYVRAYFYLIISMFWFAISSKSKDHVHVNLNRENELSSRTM